MWCIFKSLLYSLYMQREEKEARVTVVAPDFIIDFYVYLSECVWVEWVG